MLTTAVFLPLVVSAAGPEAQTGPARNALYRVVQQEGVRLGGARFVLPEPRMQDGMTADAERAALRSVAGSDRAAAELARESVSAPIVLKLRDTKAESGVVRAADLWFVVHAGLDRIDPDRATEARTVEAGNMRIVSVPLSERDVARAGGDPGEGRWVHMTGRLLDRIHVEATDMTASTRTENSWLIASRTDPRFADDAEHPNRWHTVAREGGRESAGKDRPFPGGVSYVQISRLATVPGALFVEAHFAFFEPDAWFDGAPILRSKIGVVAQDRIRGLRRDLAKSREAGPARTPSGPKGR